MMKRILLFLITLVCVQFCAWATDYTVGSTTITIDDNDATKATITFGDPDDIVNFAAAWNSSPTANQINAITDLKVKYTINEALVNFLGANYPWQNCANRLDYSDATGYTITGVPGAVKRLILPKGSSLPSDGDLAGGNAFNKDHGLMYVMAPNATGTSFNVWGNPEKGDGELWVDDPLLTSGTTVNVYSPSTLSDEALATLQAKGVNVVMAGSGSAVTLTANEGDLATQIAAMDSENCPETVNIEGTLNAADVAALKNLPCGEHILMNKATLTNDAKTADFSFANNTKVQTIVLPKGLDEVKESWFNGCTSLGSAISYSIDNDGNVSIKTYCKVAGTLNETLQSLSLNETDSDLASSTSATGKVTEVIVKGNVNASDLAGGHMPMSTFTGAPIKHWDLSGAVLSDPSDILAAGNGATSTEDKGYRATLEQIEFPADLTEIPPYCFYTFKNLSGEVFVPNTVKTIGECAFYMCTSLSKVEFQENMPEDFACGDYAFSECWGIKHIVLPEGLTVVSKGMFQRCYNLESIRLPNTLTRIEEAAFEQADALSYLTIPENVEFIGQKAFFNSGVKDLYLMAPTPDKLPEIYSIGNDGTLQGQSSFGGDNVDGYNNFPDVDEYFDYLKTLVDRGLVQITSEDQADYTAACAEGADINEKNINRWLKYLTSDQMEEVYRLHAAATERPITAIHYADTPEMNEFFHHNPWKGDETFCNSLNMSAYDDGYGRAAEEQQRYLEADYLTEAYGLGPDKYGKRWPTYNHRDYDLRVQWGYPGNAINADDPLNSANKQDPSRLGWRQFVLSFGYSPNNDDEVYAKDYDDTWYTMCFPFDLSDEQLEGAFNSNFNICEFNGVAVVETETTEKDPATGELYKDEQGNVKKVKNLVLLFTNIAKTYYRDKYGNFYDRVKINKEVEKEGSTVIVSEKWYHPVVGTPDGKGGYDMTYTTNQYVPSGTSYNGEDGWFTYDNAKTNGSLDVYESIRGVLAQAGHPYMIHPQKVEDANGGATQCVLNHIQYKFEYTKLKKLYEANPDDATARQNYEEALALLTSLYDTEKVTRKLSKVKEGTISESEEGDYDVVNKAGGKVYLETVNDNVTYTFKGSFEPDKTVAIPNRAYFLGVPPGTKYPKFFREKNGNTNTGYWGQFSAVIIPNDAAKAWEDANIEVKPYSSGNNAKAASMGFGDFEEVTADEIEAIVADAKEKKQPVQFMNVVVNINGQVVRDGLDMTGLPKGIYIVNGKKYMVK
ncbi:MAG: leucine-rich repeat domain-containing protein [Prevotella sp.]|nr:leucine-rich repeat domain-containing protein [Prevotella sp.]